jgi:predicted small secreted protein
MAIQGQIGVLRMKTLLVLSAIATAAIGVAGCNTPQEQNAGAGALLGGATGALIGAAATGKPGGALVGGAIGAATGAAVGAASTPPGPYYGPGPYAGPPPRCAQFYYDYSGNRVCQAWY